VDLILIKGFLLFEGIYRDSKYIVYMHRMQIYNLYASNALNDWRVMWKITTKRIISRIQLNIRLQRVGRDLF